MKQDIFLSLQHISAEYEGIRALDAVDMIIHEGEIVALMGPNGAGKSTILKVIFGLLPYIGTFAIHGVHVRPVTHRMHEWGIALVPQGRRVFSGLTVDENLAIAGMAIRSSSLLRARIAEAIAFFPVLSRKLYALAGTLSGGEQQMLALARGLIMEPRLLLLDEPSLGLSPKVAHEVFQKIIEINQRRNTAILIVEHNLQSIARLAHRAYLLDRGSVAAHGVAREVISGLEFQRVFFGKT